MFGSFWHLRRTFERAPAAATCPRALRSIAKRPCGCRLHVVPSVPYHPRRRPEMSADRRGRRRPAATKRWSARSGLHGSALSHLGRVHEVRFHAGGARGSLRRPRWRTRTRTKPRATRPSPSPRRRPTPSRSTPRGHRPAAKPHWQARREPAHAHRRLQRAALALFLQYGIEAVTIDQIVDGARTAKGSFYRYFRDKTESKPRSLRCTSPTTSSSCSRGGNTCSQLPAPASRAPRMAMGT